MNRHVCLLRSTAVTMTWRQSNFTSANQLLHLSMTSLTRNVVWSSVVHGCMNLVRPKYVHLRKFLASVNIGIWRYIKIISLILSPASQVGGMKAEDIRVKPPDHPQAEHGFLICSLSGVLTIQQWTNKWLEIIRSRPPQSKHSATAAAETSLLSLNTWPRQPPRQISVYTVGHGSRRDKPPHSKHSATAAAETSFSV